MCKEYVDEKYPKDKNNNLHKKKKGGRKLIILILLILYYIYICKVFFYTKVKVSISNIIAV